MALSTIDRVKAAEIAASEARDKAELQAQAILDDANAKAEAIVKEAQMQADAEEKAQASAAQASAEKKILERRLKAQENADALRDKTMKLRQNVINKLIQETLVK